MVKTLLSNIHFSLLVLIGLATPATLKAGVAMCEHKMKSPTDVIFRVVSDNNKSSLHLDSEVRALIKDARGDSYKGYPSCSRFLAPDTYDGSHWVYKVAKVERKDYEGKTKITYAIGFGPNSVSAGVDLVKDIGRGDWGWRKKHGYEIVASGNFIEPETNNCQLE